MKKLVAVGFAFSLLLTACGAREAAPFDTLAQCLTDKGFKMYGADTCPHCQQQKKLFKGSFDLIDYVECNQNPTACEEAGISAYPTWMVDDQAYVGRKSMSELAELADCSLREPGPSEVSEDEEAPAEDDAAEEAAE